MNKVSPRRISDPPHVMADEFKPRKGTFDEFISTLIWAAVIAIIIRSLLFEPFSIPSGSMKPTLQEGDFLFVNKWVYGYSRYSFPMGLGPVPQGTRLFGKLPERGDIIVFKLPTNPGIDYIKRVVGLPGDHVQVRGGRLYINDQIVNRQEIGVEESKSPMGYNRELVAYMETLPNGVEHVIFEESDDMKLDNTNVFIVPEGHVFAMGDNRDNSQDSRVQALVGYIPLENIVGKAERIFLSVDGTQSKLWQIWNWPKAFRFDRIFMNLVPDRALETGHNDLPAGS